MRDLTDRTFTANFVDLDDDGRSDLVVTADYGQSTVWLNQGSGRFANATNVVISDQNGMGSAVGDYDGDGDLDWFVSSIRDGDGTTEGNWGTSGNRLYRNRGDGTFEDATDAAGVRDGDWGWGASFADFNNDGSLDLVHVNGWPQGSPQFRGTRARLFVAVAGGTLRRPGRRARLRRAGRGPRRRLLRLRRRRRSRRLRRQQQRPPSPVAQRRRPRGGHYLDVRVMGTPPNPFAIGAKIYVSAGGREQVRDVRAGSNYVSQNPREVHFGLGAAARVDTVRVVWPDGRQLTLTGIDADQTLVVRPTTAGPARRASRLRPLTARRRARSKDDGGDHEQELPRT